MSIIPREDPRFPEGDDRRQRVTHTLLGEEYGWDSFADINWPMLRQNRDCMENVLSHPEQFPRANVPSGGEVRRPRRVPSGLRHRESLMAYWTDDRKLDQEQRRLDAQQADAAAAIEASKVAQRLLGYSADVEMTIDEMADEGVIPWAYRDAPKPFFDSLDRKAWKCVDCDVWHPPAELDEHERCYGCRPAEVD